MQIALRILLSITSVCLGAIGLVVGILPEVGRRLLDDYRDRLLDPGGRIASIAVGSLLVLIPLAILLRWYAGRRYAREISYTTENGRVAVSLIAIEEALTRAIEQERVVRKVQVRVYEDRVKRCVVVEAALTLWDDGDVSSVNRRCQQLMRQRFAELMPEQQAVQVHLVVHRLSHRRRDEGDPDEDTGRHPRRRERATRTTDDEDAERPEDVIRDGPVPLPGLAATHGSVDISAGAELLRRRRETREGHEDEDRRTTALATGAGEQPGSPEEQAAEVSDAEATEGEDEFGDLYQGPNYPVGDDEEDTGSQLRS